MKILILDGCFGYKNLKNVESITIEGDRRVNGIIRRSLKTEISFKFIVDPMCIVHSDLINNIRETNDVEIKIVYPSRENGDEALAIMRPFYWEHSLKSGVESVYVKADLFFE